MALVQHLRDHGPVGDAVEAEQRRALSVIEAAQAHLGLPGPSSLVDLADAIDRWEHPR